MEGDCWASPTLLAPLWIRLGDSDGGKRRIWDSISLKLCLLYTSIMRALSLETLLTQYLLAVAGSHLLGPCTKGGNISSGLCHSQEVSLPFGLETKAEAKIKGQEEEAIPV